MEELKTMSAAVRVVIDNYPPGHRFYGNQLKDDVVKIYPEAENMYPDTILRMARHHRRYAFRAVDQNNSLYEKLYVKPILEVIKEIRETEEKKELPKRLSEPVKQMDLPFLFTQVFLAVFLVWFWGQLYYLFSLSDAL